MGRHSPVTLLTVKFVLLIRVISQRESFVDVARSTQRMVLPSHADSPLGLLSLGYGTFDRPVLGTPIARLGS